MNASRLASSALLLLGAALLVWGWDAYRAPSSAVSRLFTGAPTDKALVLLIGGGILTAAGLRGISRL